MTSFTDTPRSRGNTDAPHMSPATPAEDARTIMINQISWGAVFAGVVLTLAIQLILNMLGVGIGAASLNPGDGASQNPEAATLGIGAGVWFLVAGIIASFVGGYASGRLGGKPKESTSGWHGLVTWALSTLLIFYLLTTAVGGIIGGAYSTLTGALGGVASTVGAAAQTAVEGAATAASGEADPLAGLADAIPAGTGEDAAALRDAAVASVRALITGDEASADAAREEAAQAIVEARGVTIDEARTQVQELEAQYRETATEVQEQVTEVADTAASAVSTGMLFGAIGLILAAIAAWFGGRMGAVDPTLTRLLSRSTSTTTKIS